MRRIIFLFSVVFLFSFTLSAQDDRETIEGNGKLVTREVSVKAFDQLEAHGIYELKLTQGDKESVRIEADENLQGYFTVTNEGSTLMIDTKKLKDKNLKGKVKMRERSGQKKAFL